MNQGDHRMQQDERTQFSWLRFLWRLVKWTSAVVALIVGAIVVWCLIPLRATVPALKPRPNTQYWIMSKGYRIAFTHVPRVGSSNKPPILFLHGGPGGYVHSSAIRTFGQLAARGHDVFLYDQVGSGLSDRLPRPKDYTFLGHVEDLHEIVTRHLAARKVILIGQSYGGIVAAQFIATYPQLVDRMVLSSPGALQPGQFDEEGKWLNESKYIPPASLKFVKIEGVPTDGIRFWPARGLAAMALATVFNVKLMPDAEADGVLNTLATRFTRNGVCNPQKAPPEEGGSGFYSHGWSNWFGDLEDPRPALRKVTAPVLVLQGACDFIPYAAAYEYVDLLQNSQYVFVEGAGHVIWWEKQVEYVEQITRFLEKEGGGR